MVEVIAEVIRVLLLLAMIAVLFFGVIFGFAFLLAQ